MAFSKKSGKTSRFSAGKRLQLNMPVSTNNGQVIETANFNASYGYNSEGQITSLSYPPVNSYGPAYNYSYDSLARLNGMTNPNDLNQNDGPVVSNAAYGMANELLSFDYGTNYARTYETRGYNSLFQLTSISSGNVSMQYIYPSAGANNGKACLVVDAITGEQTVYGYDSLNRLASAYTHSNSAPNSGCVQGSGNALSWWQGFGYDGFGNLTDKNSSGSPVPSMHIAVDPTTNRINSSPWTYDANGNMTYGPNGTFTYDVENRLGTATPYVGSPSFASYAYDAQNRRIGSWTPRPSANVSRTPGNGRSACSAHRSCTASKCSPLLDGGIDHDIEERKEK